MTWFALILWHVFGVHHVLIRMSVTPDQVRRVRYMPNGRPYVKRFYDPVFLDGEDLPGNITPLTWGGGPRARR